MVHVSPSPYRFYMFDAGRISRWMCLLLPAVIWVAGSVQPGNAQTTDEPSQAVSPAQTSGQSGPTGGKAATTPARKPSPPHGKALPDREILLMSLRDFDPDVLRHPLPLLQIGEEIGKHVCQAGSPRERHAAFVAIPHGLRNFVHFTLPVPVRHELYRIQAEDYVRRHPEKASEVAVAVSIHPEYSLLVSRREPGTGRQLARDTLAAYDLLYAQSPSVQDTFMAIVDELLPSSCSWNFPAGMYLTTEGQAYLKSIVDIAPSTEILLERMKSRTLPRPDPATEKRLPSGAMPLFDGIFYCRPGELPSGKDDVPDEKAPVKKPETEHQP